jgi:hypothetical protein
MHAAAIGGGAAEPSRGLGPCFCRTGTTTTRKSPGHCDDGGTEHPFAKLCLCNPRDGTGTHVSAPVPVSGLSLAASGSGWVNNTPSPGPRIGKRLRKLPPRALEFGKGKRHSGHIQSKHVGDRHHQRRAPRHFQSQSRIRARFVWCGGRSGGDG